MKYDVFFSRGNGIRAKVKSWVQSSEYLFLNRF